MLDQLMQLNVAAWPVDWIVLIAFVSIVLVDSLRSGPAKSCALALSFPVTTFIVNELPKTFIIDSAFLNIHSPMQLSIVFLVVLLVVAFIIYKMMHPIVTMPGRPMQALLGTMAVSIVTITMWLQTPALGSLWHFNDMLQTIFAEQYRVGWLIAGYIALAFASAS